MLLNIPEMSQHIILALDHHRQLIDEAKRYREGEAARRTSQERLPRWRRWRVRVGELLINSGQRLAPEIAFELAPEGVRKSHTPKSVWG